MQMWYVYQSALGYIYISAFPTLGLPHALGVYVFLSVDATDARFAAPKLCTSRLGVRVLFLMRAVPDGLSILLSRQACPHHCALCPPNVTVLLHSTYLGSFTFATQASRLSERVLARDALVVKFLK